MSSTPHCYCHKTILQSGEPLTSSHPPCLFSDTDLQPNPPMGPKQSFCDHKSAEIFAQVTEMIASVQLREGKARECKSPKFKQDLHQPLHSACKHSLRGHKNHRGQMLSPKAEVTFAEQCIMLKKFINGKNSSTEWYGPDASYLELLLRCPITTVNISV